MASKISISGYDGNLYEYSQNTGLISVNGEIVSDQEYEPVFIHSSNPDDPPIFSGIYVKRLNQVIGLHGGVNQVVDPDLIKFT